MKQSIKHLKWSFKTEILFKINIGFKKQVFMFRLTKVDYIFKQISVIIMCTLKKTSRKLGSLTNIINRLFNIYFFL